MLKTRKSLGKGGLILAKDALEIIKKKRCAEAADAVRKAERVLRLYENKKKKALYDKGVLARKEEKARKARVAAYTYALGIEPLAAFENIPIRDPEKQPNSEEMENLMAPQSMRDAVAFAKHEQEKVASNNISVFTDTEIKPEILQLEEQFKLRQRGGISYNLVLSDTVEEEDQDLKQGEASSSSICSVVNLDSDSNYDSDATLSPPRSVASIDSIRGNDRFLRFQ
jgi:hypothetical protein